SADTTYYENSMCIVPGELKLYVSLTDDNVGNALSDGAEWLLVADFADGVVLDGSIDPAKLSTGHPTWEVDGSAVVSANSTAAALRVTQTGAGDALLIEDSANPDSTPWVVNGSGRQVVGATATQMPGTGPLSGALVEIDSAAQPAFVAAGW